MIILSIENRAALRTALAAVTAILTAFAYHMDKPYWAGMTVVLVANVYTGSILDKAVMRILGTVLGAWSGFFLVGFVEDSILLYFLLNFFIVAIAVYYYNFSRYAYAWLLGAIAAFIVISEVAVTPTEALNAAFWRPVEITLGVLVSAVFALCVFPNRLADKVAGDINSIFEGMDSLLEKSGEWLFEQDRALLLVIAAENTALKTTARHALEKIGMMRYEFEYPPAQLGRYQFLLEACLGFCRALKYFHALNTFSSEAVCQSLPIKQGLEAIRQDFARLHTDFFSQHTSPLQTEAVLVDFDRQFALMEGLAPEVYKYLLSLRHFFQQMYGMLSRIQVIIQGSGNGWKAPSSVSTQQQLRRDPDVIIHAIKAGSTAVLALGAWLFMNIPAGLNGIISSIIISARRNLFDMHNIGAWRLLGCILGGGIGICTLLAFQMGLYLLLAIIFLTVWAFSYFSFKQEQYAYIGMQANIAVILALAQSAGAATSIMPALDRLTGVVIGIVASLVVANLLWRMSLLTMIQRQLQKLRLNLRHNVACLLRGEDGEMPFFNLTDAFWRCRELLDEASQKYALTSTDPARWKSNQHQVARAKAVEKGLNAIQVTLNNMRESTDRAQACQTAHACGIDLEALEGRVLGLYLSTSDQDSHALHQSIGKAIATLMTSRNARGLTDAEVRNCAAWLYGLDQIEVARVENAGETE